MFTDRCPLDRLHAISALGTKLCFYTLDRTNLTITPPRLAGDPNRVVDVMPANLWEYDLLEEDGVRKLQEVVADIDKQCAAQGMA